MADTPDPGGIFLRRPGLLKWATVAAALFVLFLAAAWTWREPLLEKAAKSAAARAGLELVFDERLSVSRSEIRTGRLRMSGPGFSVSLVSASFNSSWGDLLKGRHWLEADISGLSVSARGGGNGGPPVFFLPSLYPLKGLEVSGGSVSAGGGTVVVGRLSASAGPGGALLRALELETGGTPVSAAGSCSAAGCSLSGTAGPSGNLPDAARFSAEIFRSSAAFSAVLPSAGLRASGSAGFDGSWSSSVSFSSAAWGVAGRCGGHGRGYDPAALTASASCALRAADLPLRASVAAEKGEFSFSASASTTAASASASGVYVHPEGRLDARLEASGDLPLPGGAELRGFSLQASASGRAGALSASAELRAGTVTARGFTAAPVSLSVSAVTGPGRSFSVGLEAGALAAGGVDFSSVSFKGRGSPARHIFGLTAAAPGGTLSLSGSGSYRESWEGEIASFEGFGLRLRRPFQVHASAEGGGFSGLVLAYGPGELNVSAYYAGGRFSPLEAEARGFEIAAASAALSRLSVVSGKLDASLRLSGPPMSPEGELSLRSAGISVGGFRLGRFRADAEFAGGRISSREAWLETPGGRLESSFSAAPGDPEGENYFTVVSSETDVSFLSAFLPGVELGPALLNSDIKVSRSSSTLLVEGRAVLSAAHMALKDLGLKLGPVDLDLRPAGAGGGVSLSGFAVSNGGWLEAEGKLSPAGPDLRLRGSRFGFNSLYGVRGSAVSAELRVSGPWASPLFTGTFGLSELRFDQERWDRSPASGDKPSAYGLDLAFSIPRNAWYRSEAGAIEGRGEISVRKTPLRPLFITGQIESVRGSYAYLGKSFDVKSARINFAGKSPPDPAIYLLAAYDDKVNSMRVYFEAEGTMRYPKSRLYSEPPMEQRDIMSVMVTGRPLYALYSNGNGGVPERSGASATPAEQALAGYISGRAGLLVRDRLDLDMLNIRMTQERRADVTIGRYLTSDLFVSYGQTLGPRGEKRVNAEYSLSKRLSLEGKTSSEGLYSADLLFKIGIR